MRGYARAYASVPMNMRMHVHLHMRMRMHMRIHMHMHASAFIRTSAVNCVRHVERKTLNAPCQAPSAKR
eukprot:6215312-Lingulodinium_polyedra.AAC.1